MIVFNVDSINIISYKSFNKISLFTAGQTHTMESVSVGKDENPVEDMKVISWKSNYHNNPKSTGNQKSKGPIAFL